MALSFGQTGTADSIDAEYFLQEGQDAPVFVHMHLDALDGIARDTIEGFASLPRRGAEVGGLLLGHVEPGQRPTVWIDRYQRIACSHHFGPQFVLDQDEHRALEEAAAAVSRDGELAVVGFYRSHTRSGFQLEPDDLELITRYFNDPADLILLIHPENMIRTDGRFFARGRSGDVEPIGDSFPVRGRTAPVEDLQPDTARTSLPEKPRRIVPDFTPAAVPLPARPSEPDTPEEDSDRGGFLRRWLPLIAAILLVGCAVGFLLIPASNHREPAPPPASVAAPIRPLGLYVDPSGSDWRVSWNPAATALKNARGVQLFVRDGEDQSRIDLAPADLQSGTYQYQPKGSDVTFRLEVAEANGHVSAESFRFMKPPTSPAPVAAPATLAVPAPRAPARSAAAPVAVHRVAPVVPASIRPRIRATVPVDVRVVVDARGRVTSAVPVGKHSAGLQSYLADRAVAAAEQWRFEAGAPGSETIHFVFEK